MAAAIERLHLAVHLDKSKVIVFRKGGFLGIKEKWHLNGDSLEVVNSYKYLGLTFSTKHSFAAAMDEVKVKGKKYTIEMLGILRKIGCSV